MIRFRCKNCNQKIGVKEIYAGKKGKCPKCKSTVVVPSVEQMPAAEITLVEPVSEYPASDESSAESHELEEVTATEATEPPGKRKLPWPIDILLYPLSTAGLTILAIIILIPLLIHLTAVLLGPFGFFISIPGLVIRLVIGLYMYWYFCECIRDSAEGGLRAPDVLVNAPTLGEMFWQTLRIVGCAAFCLLPMLVYYLCTQKTDMIFQGLMACAAFFFPMALLAVIMFDSLAGLNPVLLVGSIFSTFFQYCGLVLVFVGIGFFFSRLTDVQSSVLALVFSCLTIYLSLIAGHLLGRFYWRYQEKLRWGV